MWACRAGLGQNAPMADQATETMEIAAPADRILDVLLDFDAYPTWAKDLKGVTVESRDDEGRAQRGHVPGRRHGPQHQLHAALRPRRRRTWAGSSCGATSCASSTAPTSWRPAGADGRTLVTYHLAVDLIIPLPGFVKRRAEQKIIHTALRELRAHVEAR